ncbi:udp N-acetylglucosamine O-acyltransferase domain 2 family protein [Chlamydia psittaci 03DC29]|nr:udp N-acetylglucosamine O-acyltransferase domain 2 family protein [Chlamydia psittaci 03DC29]
MIKVFKKVYRSEDSFFEALLEAQEEYGHIPEVQKFIHFCQNPSKRGIERGAAKEAFQEESVDKEGALVES